MSLTVTQNYTENHDHGALHLHLFAVLIYFQYKICSNKSTSSTLSIDTHSQETSHYQRCSESHVAKDNICGINLQVQGPKYVCLAVISRNL